MNSSFTILCIMILLILNENLLQKNWFQLKQGWIPTFTKAEFKLKKWKHKKKIKKAQTTESRFYRRWLPAFDIWWLVLHYRCSYVNYCGVGVRSLATGIEQAPFRLNRGGHQYPSIWRWWGFEPWHESAELVPGSTSTHYTARVGH